MALQTWLLFLPIAFITTITPGPAILLATSHSLTYGLHLTIFTILGNITGLLLMSALSVLGLSAIILGSVFLFTAIKVIGALYLIYLGAILWHKGFARVPNKGTNTHAPKASAKRLYLNGLVVALSNPKSIAFTMALFPQFIDPTQNLMLQFGILVGSFMLLSFSCIFGFAYLTIYARHRFSHHASGLVSKLFSILFVAFGIALLSSSHKI